MGSGTVRIMGSVLLIIFDPYSTFVSLRKKRPSVLLVGATQHQLLLRESVSHRMAEGQVADSAYLSL